MKWARELQSKNCAQKAPKTKFHYRLLPDELAYEISGY
jgi:hypothetical protein